MGTFHARYFSMPYIHQLYSGLDVIIEVCIFNLFVFFVCFFLPSLLPRRASCVDDVMLSSSEIKHVALSIEEELFNYYGGVNSRYKYKFKSILIHVKDSKNKVGANTFSTGC